MHSSIINKIRILKPRKKSDSQLNMGVIKSFTINNDNYHASIVSKEKIVNDNPPPLVPPPNNESKEPSTSKWVPFYFVNVPKENEKGMDSKNDSNTTKNASYLEIKDDSLKTLEQNIESVHTNSSNVPIRSMRLRSGLGKERVTCFLCPKMFDSVQNMQEHYLENHKHKKKLTNNNSNNNNTNNNTNNNNSNSSKTTYKKGLKNLKPKDPLKITDEDTNTGDGEPKCPICSIYFKTKEEVKSHMTSVHCYKCSECHNTFYTLYQFTDHRCTKYVKQKKTKLKKKIKTVTINKNSLVSSSSNSQCNNLTNIQPKTVQLLPTASYPVILNYPSEKQVLYTQPQGTGSQMVFSNSRLITNSICDVESSVKKYTHQSLLNCTPEQLTSKDFIKMKLDEILKNPHLSVNWIPKNNPDNVDSDQEFFSCGRCNVLCEDKADYIEHLEECLRLSNVSIFESSSSERILKLKSEVIPQRNSQSNKTTINKSLLKELQNFIEPENLGIFNSVEENTSLQNNTDTVINNNNNNYFTHPDIKGNISITKINSTINSGALSSTGALSNMRIARQPTQSVPIQMLQSNQNQNLTAFLGTKQTLSSKQPMVLIPLNNTLQGNSLTVKEKDFDSPDYPNISITDKSNSVTWNFIGSESGSILRVESPFEKNLPVRVDKSNSFVTLKNKNFVQLPMLSAAGVISSNKINTPVISLPNDFPSQESDLIKPKEEPVSPNPSLADSPSPSFNEMKDNCASMELVLDEEEIKMEVEEEVVDDQF